MNRIVALCLLVITSCSPVSKRALIKTLQQQEKTFQHHVGFVLYDVKNQTTISYKGNHYFTPASNTKIFTLFSSLKLLGDSLRGLRYLESEDSLFFWGTADPSLLFSKTHSSSRVLEFLQQKSKTKQLCFSTSNFNTATFGKGWAWDDYNDYYSAERSALPVYGNCLRIWISKNYYKAKPHAFSISLTAPLGDKPKVIRDQATNTFTVVPSVNHNNTVLEVPFKTSAEITAVLLSDTLQKKIIITNKPLNTKTMVLKSVPADSVYKVMMKESDNFIAEHLLLQCADVISDTLNPDIAIQYVQKDFLYDLPDSITWVDGSGLSRYNLFTPRSIVEVWKKVYELVPQKKRLFSMLAIGGEEGTLENYFKSSKPYIFGKTGTLSNNHTLSGYLVTKRGRLYIFAYMNANFVEPTRNVRQAMESLLNTIYEKR